MGEFDDGGGRFLEVKCFEVAGGKVTAVEFKSGVSLQSVKISGIAGWDEYSTEAPKFNWVKFLVSKQV